MNAAPVSRVGFQLWEARRVRVPSESKSQGVENQAASAPKRNLALCIDEKYSLSH